MANLTITVDQTVLWRARQRAVAERTSVAAEIREFLQRYARADSGFEGFLALSRDLDATSRFRSFQVPAPDLLYEDGGGEGGDDDGGLFR